MVLSFLLRDDGAGALDSPTRNLTINFLAVNDAPAWDVGVGAFAQGLHVEVRPHLEPCSRPLCQVPYGGPRGVAFFVLARCPCRDIFLPW